MRIRTVRIENFKKFEALEVDLQSLDCLVGGNNSGKTTLLQALALFDFCVHHCLTRRNGTLELMKRTIAPEDFYVLPVANPVDLWHDRRTRSGKKQRRVKVGVTFESGEKITATLKLDYNRFGIAIDPGRLSQETLAFLANHKIAYLPVFSMFLPREERRLAAAIEDELVRGRVHGIVRNLLLEIKEKGKLPILTEILQRGFPTLRQMEIVFDQVTDRYISVTYQEQDRPKEFDIFSSGSGFQQFLYLFGFIVLRDPNVILLDEPDVHLHGSLQAILLEEFERLVQKGRQVLFATHSRELIARTSPENILSLHPPGAQRLAVAFDVFDTLDRLGSIDPAQLAMIQAYRRILIVEDRSDRDLLSIFLGKCLPAEQWQQVERRIAYCFTKGNPWKQDIDKLRRMLQQLIHVEGAPLEVFVVADWDYYPDRERLTRSLPKECIRWHVWERAEIENYLLAFPALRRLLLEREEEGSTFDEISLREEFDRLVEESRDAVNDKLVEAFQVARARQKENWDTVRMSRSAREYLREHWEGGKLALADAKDLVLPGLKRWLQSIGLGQFSDRSLAESLHPEDLPEEIHVLAKEIARFAGLTL